jgi:hypothetical protein
VYICVFFYILLSMLHHTEVILHTIMCLAIRTCLWVGDAESACAIGFGHCIPFTVYLCVCVCLCIYMCVYAYITGICNVKL